MPVLLKFAREKRVSNLPGSLYAGDALAGEDVVLLGLLPLPGEVVSSLDQQVLLEGLPDPISPFWKFAQNFQLRSQRRADLHFCSASW